MAERLHAELAAVPALAQVVRALSKTQARVVSEAET